MVAAMAVKGKKPKKPAAAKAKAKAAPKAKPKAKVATKAKAKAKAKPAAPAKQPAAKKPRAATPPPIADVIEPMGQLAFAPDFVEAPVAAEEAAAGKKPGALARLKSGVGNLFAKMTRRGAKGGESDGVPIDAPTMEIVTADIIVSAPAKTKKSRKTPPPPPASDED